MAASTNLSATELTVTPGGRVSVTLRVRNTANVVDQMTFEVIGDSKEWAQVEPAVLSLFPDDEGRVEVTFAPPRSSSVPAGPMPFGIKVSPNEDPEGSAVEEGTLDIAAFYDVSAELVPRTSRGRRQATHDLAVDNRSNVAYRADVTGSDKDLLLTFLASPAKVDVPAGSAGFAKVRVRPRRRFWRGPPKTRAFQVLLSADAPEDVGGRAVGQRASDEPGPAPLPAPGALTPPPPPPPAPPSPPSPGPAANEPPPPAAGPDIVLDGTFVQEAVLPKWLFKVLALILALALVAAALWLALVKPQIKAAARNQVTKQLAAAGITTTTSTTLPKGATTTPTTAAGQGSSPTTAAGGGGGGGGAGGGPPGATTTTVASGSGALSGAPISGRLTASGNGTLAFTVPAGKTFQLTDVILENPNGDGGALQLSRDGTVLLQTNLANFRDLDYHLVAPIVFTSTQQLQMTVSGCTNACEPGVFYSGYLK